MNDETLRELIRARQEREALQLLQQRQQQQQQQHQEQQRRDSQNILHQLNQGLVASPPSSAASLLSRARSPVEGPSPAANPLDQLLARSPVEATSASASGLDQLLASQHLLARSPVASAPAPLLGLEQLLANQRRSSLHTSSSQTNAYASVLQNSSASALSSAGLDISSLAVSQEIKRLQQLQQQMGEMRSATRDSLLFSSSQSVLPSSSSNTDPNSTLLQQYLMMQKAQLPSNLSRNTGTMGAGLTVNDTSLPAVSSAINETPNQSILEAQLLREARMIMRPNQEATASPTTFAAAAVAKAPAPFPHLHSSPGYTEGNRKMRGGVIEPFPEKLHRLLMEVELTGRTDIISFVSEGRAFAIHKSEVFFRDIVPLYFKQSRLSSFKRQLNLYGFELINSGPSRGAYYHELFQRAKPELCRRMRRVAVKVSSGKSSGTRAAAEESNKERSDIDSSSSEDEIDDDKPTSGGGVATGNEQASS